MSFSSAVPRRAAWRRGGQGGAGARVIGWLSVAAARDVQYRSPVTPGSVARAPAKAQTDLAVEALAFPVLHGDVAGEGAEQLDVAVGVVEPFPVEVADVDYLEQAARLDLSRLVVQLARAGPGAAGRQAASPSKRPSITSTPGPSRFRRASAARSAPSSMQVTWKPRRARGKVALPVAQPISRRRSPGASPATVTGSSNSSPG